MAQQYASSQPQGYKNHLQNIAIVGAGGTSGKFMVDALLKTGKHKVTAITRADSTNVIPSGVEKKLVNYDDQSSLTNALKGQDVLIITLAVRSGEGLQNKLIDAAGDAGVRWILPNEWGYDSMDPGLGKDILNLGEKRVEIHKHIETLGKSTWTGVTCGFWYEFSLGGAPERWGFDFGKRTLTYFDDGLTRQNTSTWDQVGRAVASLLSMKVLPEDESDKSPCLNQYKNDYVYISSFNLTQKDMFESVKRVTGTKDSDWKIDSQPSKERFSQGMEMLQKGDMNGFPQLMYSRVLHQDGAAEFEKTKGLQNGVLGLLKEDLDEHTKMAIEYSKEPAY
ncbi:MAG: hypothetical protein M1828_007186 [Chrysothrix sp. TS-e1954]|nr:MAG: hypothetical protein M1828_007186 [Chrysothrix sp. TS-e1954]